MTAFLSSGYTVWYDYLVHALVPLALDALALPNIFPPPSG